MILKSVKEMWLLNKNLKIIAIMNTIFVSSNALWIMYVPYFFKSAHLTGVLIGIIFGLAGVSNAIGRYFGGILSEAVGKKYDMVMGYLIFSLSPLMFLTPYYLFGFVIGPFGSGLIVPAKSIFVVEQTNKRRGLTYMFVQRFFPSLFPAAVLPIGAYLYYANLFHISLFFGFVGVVAIVPFIFKLSIPKDSKKNNTQPKFFNLSYSIFIFPFLLLLIAYSLDAFSSAAFAWYIPLFLETKGFGVLFYGVFSSLATIAIAFGSIFSGYMVDKINPYRALMLSWITLSIMVLIFAEANDLMLILFTYLVWNTIDMVDTAAAPILINDWFSKKKRTVAYGYFSGTVKAISILGLFVSGYLVEISDKLPFFIKFLFNLCGAVIIFICHILVSKRHYF